MNLAPEVVTRYRCLECGARHDGWPDYACCHVEAPEAILTPDQVAERAQVSRATVDGWIAKGLLHASRVNTVVRIRERDLDEFWTSHTRRKL